MMPFDGGLDSLPNGTLLLSCAAALLYLPMQGWSPGWRRTLVKTAAVGLLALLATIEQGPWLLVAALVFSAAGDAFLTRDGDGFFLSGLGSFLAAHVLYVALFLSLGAGWTVATDDAWRLAIDLAVIALALGLLRRLLPAVPNSLRLPVAVYVAAILAMMLAASTVIQVGVVLGATLFVASDAVLAIQKFLLPAGSSHQRWAGPSVWILYFGAQAAITWGILLL